LIIAIPAAAAAPPSMAVGRLQKIGKVLRMPAVATLSAASAITVLSL
jgi:hypothetical protein